MIYVPKSAICASTILRLQTLRESLCHEDVQLVREQVNIGWIRADKVMLVLTRNAVEINSTVMLNPLVNALQISSIFFTCTSRSRNVLLPCVNYT